MVLSQGQNTILILQGHIGFPSILDLFPFMSTGVGANDLQERCQRGLGRLPLHKPSPITNVFSAECNSSILNNTHEHTAERMGSEALLGEHELEQTEDLNHTVCTDVHLQFQDKV